MILHILFILTRYLWRLYDSNYIYLIFFILFNLIFLKFLKLWVAWIPHPHHLGSLSILTTSSSMFYFYDVLPPCDKKWSWCICVYEVKLHLICLYFSLFLCQQHTDGHMLFGYGFQFSMDQLTWKHLIGLEFSVKSPILKNNRWNLRRTECSHENIF